MIYPYQRSSHKLRQREGIPSFLLCSEKAKKMYKNDKINANGQQSIAGNAEVNSYGIILKDINKLLVVNYG